MRTIILSLLLVAPTAAADLCTSRDDWDRAFQRTDGWTGGDADYAVAAADGHTLWLYADSWIGAVRDGKHQGGSRLVNNALAVHPTPAGGAAPAPEAVQFFWGPNDADGHPTAFFSPDRERVKPRFPAQAVPEAATWYWVADAIVVPDKQGAPRLIEFLWHIGRTTGAGVWTFASVGGALAVIDNPRESPERWHAAQYDNPHVVPDAARELKPPGKTVTWGSALLIEGPWLYIYGTRAADGWNTHLVLARAPLTRVEDFSAWEFRAAADWSPELAAAAPRAEGLVSEFSVDRVTIAGRRRYVLIQSQPLFGTQILARLSDEPDGPFGKPTPIYDVPGVDPKRKYFTYAAKGHAHLSAPGHLLVSYILNSHDFAAMFNDANIYRPRFIELDLERLPRE